MKKIMVICIGVLFSIAVFAHTPLLSVDDNEDGTIYLEGGFSNGGSAGGVEILLVEDKEASKDDKSFEGKKVLYKGLLNDEGASDVLKANVVSYQVVFNAGPGHIVYKPGIRISVDEREEWQTKLEEKREEAKEANDTELLKWLDLIENK